CRRRPVPAAAPPGPGAGRPAFQPPPLRRGPDGGGVRGPPARPGRPGRPAWGAAGRGRPHHAADPGLALAPARPLAGVWTEVPVVGGIGYARVRRRPAPDLLPGAHATGPRW